jgi:teichuronic acid biosynthesis glycosyltransferase TuaH
MRPYMRGATQLLVRRALRRAVDHIGCPVRATIAATLLPVFGVVGEQRRIFYATDDFVAGAALMTIDPTWLRRQEANALAGADDVIVVSEVLGETYRARGIDPVVIPNGVDDALFASVDDAAPPKDVHLSRPIAGFVGHLSDRIDIAFLEAVADTKHSVLLVGPRQLSFDMTRIAGLLSRPNVQWVGAKRFEELPSYLSVIDVGILPYGDSAFNRASSPLKTLEYLAAGRAAVTTDLPAIRALHTDLIEVAGEPRAFAAATERALLSPPSAALVARRREFAATHSWDRRAAQVMDLIRDPRPSRPAA